GGRLSSSHGVHLLRVGHRGYRFAIGAARGLDGSARSGSRAKPGSGGRRIRHFPARTGAGTARAYRRRGGRQRDRRSNRKAGYAGAAGGARQGDGGAAAQSAQSGGTPQLTTGLISGLWMAFAMPSTCFIKAANSSDESD